jgi:hypothetical protein
MVFAFRLISASSGTALRRLGPSILLLIQLVSLNISAAAQEAAVEKLAVSLRCQMFCSETKLRTGVAVLSWAEDKVAPVALSDARIDVTVYKDGFQGNAFASFTGIGAGQKATLADGMVKALDGKSAPRAFDITLVDALKAEGAATPALGRVAATVPRGETGVAVENLEPAVNYLWRLRFQRQGKSTVSETVMCMAPVCPADMVGEKQ